MPISPAAEVVVDEPLVRALLAEQHPDLAALPLAELGAGWDNTLWRLGDDLLVRLPRRAAAVPLVEHEQRWLPGLAPMLPLPVPAPLRLGRPSEAIGYPWPWSVVPWLDGTPGDEATMERPDDAARRLGRFLRALHVEAPSDAPRNPVRGVPVGDRLATFEERLAALAVEIDEAAVRAVRAVWDRALAAPPFAGPPRWLHGDLHPGNVLVANGTVAAVIDFGDLCAGDPASDLAGAWMLLPADAVSVLLAAYAGIDPALEARALGWAVLFGLMFVSIGLEGRPTYAAVGRRTIERATGWRPQG